jgi:Kef-type K+ transport system membrane component KefB/Trk K+ transport system NAD-binding subunit
MYLNISLAPAAASANDLSFLPLLIVVLLALAVPLILSRIKFISPPIVVGEIIAGIIVGRSGFNLVDPDIFIIELLAEFGLAYLFFLAGMEIDFESLGLKGNRQSRPQTDGWGPIALGSIIFGLTLGAGYLVSLGIAAITSIENVGFLTLIFAPSSLGLIVAVLKERELTATRFGQVVLTAALIADFGTVILLTVYVAFLEFGLSLQAFLVGTIFIVFLAMYFITSRFSERLPVRRLLENLSTATAQIKLRIAFALLLLFSTLSQVLDAKIVLGSFLAGALLSLLANNDDREAIHQMEAVGFGFFIPIFFVRVGLTFDLPALFGSREALLLVPLLVIGAIAVKVIPALILSREYSMQTTLAAGFLLSARLSLIIAEAAIGVELDILSGPLNADIILVALILATITPLIFNRYGPDAPAPERPPPVIVAGANVLGLEVGAQLRAHLADVVFLDFDEQNIATARKRGFEALRIDFDAPSAEAGVFLEQATTFVSSYSDPEINYRVCTMARRRFGVHTVVAQVPEPNELIRFEALGVKTMNSALDRAAHLVLLARNPDMYDLLTRTDDDKEVVEVVVREQPYVGKLLRQCRLPGDVLVLAIRRDGELLVPHANTRLDRDDHLTLVGSRDYIREAYQMLTGLQLPRWKSDYR